MKPIKNTMSTKNISGKIVRTSIKNEMYQTYKKRLERIHYFFGLPLQMPSYDGQNLDHGYICDYVFQPHTKHIDHIFNFFCCMIGRYVVGAGSPSLENFYVCSENSETFYCMIALEVNRKTAPKDILSALVQLNGADPHQEKWLSYIETFKPNLMEIIQRLKNVDLDVTELTRVNNLEHLFEISTANVVFTPLETRRRGKPRGKISARFQNTTPETDYMQIDGSVLEPPKSNNGGLTFVKSCLEIIKNNPFVYFKEAIYKGIIFSLRRKHMVELMPSVFSELKRMEQMVKSPEISNPNYRLQMYQNFCYTLGSLYKTFVTKTKNFDFYKKLLENDSQPEEPCKDLPDWYYEIISMIPLLHQPFTCYLNQVEFGNVRNCSFVKLNNIEKKSLDSLFEDFVKSQRDFSNQFGQLLNVFFHSSDTANFDPSRDRCVEESFCPIITGESFYDSITATYQAKGITFF